MNEDQKKYFLTLSATGNITAAAEKLYISRQGLSKSLRNLEKSVGAELFIRSKQGVNLTPAGEILLEYLREDERLWTACLASINALGKIKPELVRIGLQNMYFNYDQKRAVLSAFQGDPKIKVEVVDGDHDEYWEAIVEGRMEFAFTLGPPDGLAMPAILLRKDSLVILVGTSNPLSQANSVDFKKDLPGKTVLQTSAYKEKLYGTIFQKHGIKTELLSPDKDLVLARVATGNDFFIIQKSYARSFITKQVRMKPLINCPIEMNTFFVFRPDLSPAARVLAQIMLATLDKEDEFNAFFDTEDPILALG